MKRHQQGPPTHAVSLKTPAKMAGVYETMFSLLLGDAGATTTVGLDAMTDDIGADTAR